MINLSNKQLTDLTKEPALMAEDLTSVTDIDFSQNNLGAESSAYAFQTQLLNIIYRAPSLKFIDISLNPFLSPEVILAVHEDIDYLNQSRTTKIYLKSEYADWLEHFTIPENITHDMLRTYWLLLEWPKTEQPQYCLRCMDTVIEHHPETKPYYEGEFMRQLLCKNAKGKTLFAEIIELSSYSLLRVMIDYMSADAFWDELLRYEDKNLSPETINIIARTLSYPIGRSDLARRMLDHYPVACPVLKLEVLACISTNEGNYAEAYDLYLKAIEKGSGSAHAALIQLLEAHPIENRPTCTREFKIHHYTCGAEKGCTLAMFNLVMLFEGEKNMLLSQKWLSCYESSVSQWPECNFLSATNQELLNHRSHFYTCISRMIDEVIHKRVELTKARFQSHSRHAYQQFSADRLKARLDSLFLEPAQKHIVKEIGYKMLELYLFQSLNFENMKHYLLSALTDDLALNEKLLSMDPDKFSHACRETISNYLTLHYGFSMRPPDAGCSRAPCLL